MIKMIFGFLLLLPVAAYASDAEDASLAQVRAAVAMQQAANALQAAMAGMPKANPGAAVAPVATSVAVPTPASTTVTISSELRDTLVSLSSMLITGFIAIGLAWMRNHLKIMQDAAMNDTLTKSANGFGALLVQMVQQRGGAMTSLNVHSPEVASFASSLVSAYPKFTAALGMSSEKAASIILKEAAKFAGTQEPTDVIVASEPKPVIAAPTPVVPQPDPPLAAPVPAPVVAKAVAPSWATTTPVPAKAT